MSAPLKLVEEVAQLADRAAAVLAGTPEEPRLAGLSDRLRGPLRVAIAGKVKAGKSTLLNALIGERLAPTDAGECTTIVTWYRDGSTYRVTMHPRAGESRQVPFHREEQELQIDLSGTLADDVERLEVEWPSAAMRDITFIDTPGIDSISTDISARTEDFLTADEGPSSADAVLYLMRHLHESDVRFLESFHDQVASQPGAINAIAVLSRADEIGVGRLDAMGSARRIALRYSSDPKVRRLCQLVMPLAGLVAETGVTLRQEEFRQLQLLASADRKVLDELLVSVDRFVSSETDLPITKIERNELLDRFGLFGIRLGCALIRQERASTSSELAEALVDRSGLAALREVLRSNFANRSDVLRCRSALLTIEDALSGHSVAGVDEIQRDLERIFMSVHEFREVQLLVGLRSGAVSVPADRVDEAERLLGSAGPLAHERLGLAATDPASEVLAAAAAAHGYWQALSENPLMDRATMEAARVVARSCEGLIAAAHAASTVS